MSDTALGPFPTQPGVDQLAWLVRAAAIGEVSPEDFVKSFRSVHEAIESTGRIRYASKDQARLIWDVLWDLEYYSPDPAGEANPDEWNSLDEVMKTVKRVAEKLAELPQ